MKKSVKSLVYLSLTLISGSAFALPDAGMSALQSVISATDAQLAPSMSAARDQLPAFAAPVPSADRSISRKVVLTDITEKSTQQYVVVSAYPDAYKLFQSEENSRIVKVFQVTDPRGQERRIEFYFTGGDWMQYGLVYFVTNAGQTKEQVKVYPMSDLSTLDPESGAVAPAVDPFDARKLEAYIVSNFLDADGAVRAGFKSIASGAFPLR